MFGFLTMVLGSLQRRLITFWSYLIVSPNEFANKLDISESQLYNVLDNLKIRGFPISYSRKLKSYIYNEECDLKVNYSVELLTATEKISIVGGWISNYSFTPMLLE